jgi:pantetheine-phosphate adenylyltransferase
LPVVSKFKYGGWPFFHWQLITGNWQLILWQRTLSVMPTHGRVAVFPGQFDPITNGHLDVIKRATALFDEIVVGVGINPDKRELFTIDERFEMIRELTKGMPAVRVETYCGLTVDFVRKSKAVVILRGIRDASDLRYEFQLAMANRAVGNVETVFIMTGDQFALTSSSLIRQVVGLGGNVESLRGFLPQVVVEKLAEKQRRGDRFGPARPDAPPT